MASAAGTEIETAIAEEIDPSHTLRQNADTNSGYRAMARNQRSDQRSVGKERNPSGVKATKQTTRIGASMKATNSAW
jgi:hypothetical protein